MPPDRPVRRLAAVCFADIVGYTRLSATDEAAALDLVSALQRLATEEVEARGGRVVKFLGDAVLAEFASAEGALDGALTLGTRFEEACRRDGSAHTLRVGVHLGETTFADDGDVYGDVVNVAARLQTAAEPGQVLVSDDVWRQLRKRPAFLFADAGRRELKGLDEPVATWAASRRFLPPTPSLAPATPIESADGRRRLAVLPFRVLRPDPDVDFLSFGLPDAVACSLMGLHSLVVRSTASAQRWAGEQLDPVTVAREADVDLVVSGTILRAADKVRVTAQLAEGERGTLLWTEAATVAVGDLFELQDDLTRRIVDSLAVPLTGRERTGMARDVPRSGEAYELFLRANQLAVQRTDWKAGLPLYIAATEKDPTYAPAWARLARCYRLLGKYSGDEAATSRNLELAEQAFRRALELNPDLPLAHSLYAQLEVEAGRPVEAMARLLRRVAMSGGDVELFSGLTHACRYCGLMAASVAADERARSLDPQARTSVHFTWFLMGDLDRAIAAGDGVDESVQMYGLLTQGRLEEARARIVGFIDALGGHPMTAFGEAMLALVDGNAPQVLERGRGALTGFPDAEGRFMMARLWARAGLDREALELLDDCVLRGYSCPETLRRDPWLQELRPLPEFGALLERAEAARAVALEVFAQEGGPALLGVAGDES
jgi:class 3 adenylate cyclase/TolB-like protein/tetratricopeptide (TPR) repeat protein